MNWLWRWLESWRAGGKSAVRRVIVLEIDGLEPALVDEYLEQGLLHSLALLSDIGARVPLVNSPTYAIGGSICDALRKSGVRTVELLPLEPPKPTDLTAICAVDRGQQQRLFAALARLRPAVVVCKFDMPARLKQLFGPQPDESQRYVLRDVYARMDEIVGKAFSFVDEKTALLAVIRGESSGDVAPTSAETGLLYSSRKLSDSASEGAELAAVVTGLLNPPAIDS